jgi:hypothetical protein
MTMPSKLPRAVTWLVTGRAIAVCVEAATPARMNAVIAEGGGPVRVTRVEYGRDHTGRWLDPDAERVLARGIYRRLEEMAPKPEPALDPGSISGVIEAVCSRYCVTRDQLLDVKVRKRAVKYARAMVAHELNRLGLSEKSISVILQFKYKSCVTYWLSIPQERLVA